MKVYHNPRCSKSRECVNFLKAEKHAFESIHYMTEPLSEATIKELLKRLKLEPLALIRTNEKIWKEQFNGKKLSDKELIKAMITYPQLMQRPIVVNGEKAAIGRPIEAIKGIL